MNRRVAFWLVVVSGVVFVASLVLSVYTLVREEEVRGKVGPVGVVGPCRTFGPDHPECIRQSKLIHESMCRQMLLTPAQCGGSRDGRNGRPKADKGGGASSSGSSAPSIPGPPSGGPPGGGNIVGNPPTSNPPPTPPSPSPPASPAPDTSLLGPTLDQACSAVGSLGVNAC